MMPIDGQPVLTAAQMRAAEERAIAAGASVESLMQRAGEGVAAAVRRLAAGAEVLVLCGPGNNGGDGYVAAATLARAGHPVRVAALGEPKTAAAQAARAQWTGPVESFPAGLPEDAAHAPVVVDAVFGTGLSRPLEGDVGRAMQALASFARLSIAVDLPSGLDTDTGAELGGPLSTAEHDLTLALGALKPAHVLQPGAKQCGAVRLLDLGLGLDRISAPRTDVSAVETIARPRIARPEPWSHKFSRGMVTVVSGPMHGASELAALAAYRAGAGYVQLLTGGLPQRPHAIVRRRWSADALDDKRIGAAVIGPGLGRDDRAREKLEVALASDRPLVIDGDALHLLDLARLRERKAATVLTPHAGEFAALFGEGEGSKIAHAQAAARESGAVVVFKGPDTVVAQPDGLADVSTGASSWLSVAGTGDVLAGTIATMLAQRPHAPREAASAGVWLHAAAARRLAGCFIADDLANALPGALGECL
ncbi:NAD(P)H-hydrate dehydratase [Sphingomonas aracearum]|uniref:Bifunctional NAD(P)H-hydrate repair enzyme n=1 Tax=Sphingomonas aracearum TaxID=2283317 RepID=A0A369VW77_9SPHN|nr:NAD(P)H-hydrate dehydratase [Sphingomonas aracearum]RDE06598.1 NAD(P)H-hydrate dehydratase [Sphingomonas aracearum]